MTKQEIFTKVWTVLRDRGFTRAGEYRSTYHFACSYRSPVGPCAIGILMTDEEYKESLEGLSARDVIRRGACAAAEGVDDMNFFEDLQAAHDEGTVPEEMETRLKHFAEAYNLEIHA